jgi:polygalacturonase
MRSKRFLWLWVLLFPTARARATPDLPVISNQTFVVTNATFGAVGNGTTNNASALSNAIAFASSHGGGTVLIPANGSLSTYLSGPFPLASGVNLQIDSGATLKMPSFSAYPSNIDFVSGSNLHDVELSGSGTIDGSAANGSPGWWDGRATSLRPLMIMLSACQRVLIQNLHLKNPPKMHIGFKNTVGNITIQGITINTPVSPNTDGIDLAGTNCLVQNCSISDGDDNIAFSPTVGTFTGDILVTNCTFGIGHGVSIGSNTAGGLSNLTVTACSFNGTDYGIRMKSDNNTNTGGSVNGRGGMVQNLSYSNLTMTNITKGAIVIYSYYNEIGTPTGITPFGASTQSVGSILLPVWRNITISNVTATVASSGVAVILWGRMEMVISNVTLSKLNITASKPFQGYNARAVQIVDSRFTTPGTNTLSLFNAQVVVSNSAASTDLVTLRGLSKPPTNNLLSFFNAQAAILETNVLSPSPLLALSRSILTVSNNLNLGVASTLNFGLGTVPTGINAAGSLVLNGTLGVADAGGLTNGMYTLFSYSGALSYGGLSIGSAPAGYSYALDTGTVGQVHLIVGSLLSEFQQWQIQYFGSTNNPSADPNLDPDGDGQDNQAEFQSGTNPTNSASALQIISTVQQSSDMMVTWTTAGGKTNVVQAAAGGVNGSYTTNYTDISGLTIISGSGDTATNYIDSGGATNIPSRYYRVRLVP